MKQIHPAKTLRIELEPTLSHCVEAVAKSTYWRYVDNSLKMETELGGLAEKIELLRTFLEEADFGLLRHQSESLLMQGKRVIFVLTMEKGKLLYKMVCK